MNKGLFAILAAAALAASKKSGVGSRGLKRNKPLEKFDAWLNLNRMKFVENFKEEDILGIEWDSNNVNELTLSESVEQYIQAEKSNNQSSASFVLYCHHCPDAWFYMSLYMALVLDMNPFSLKYFNSKYTNSSDSPFRLSWSISTFHLRNQIKDALKTFDEFASMSLAQIKDMKKLSEIYEESTSEKILKEIKFFMDSIQHSGQNKIKDSILCQGIYGYCVIQYIRFQISVATDKNLADITKGAFLQQIKNNRIQTQSSQIKPWYGFEDIYGGGMRLFSYTDLNNGIREIAGYRDTVPALKELSIISSNEYTIEILKRVMPKLSTNEKHGGLLFDALRKSGISPILHLESSSDKKESLLNKTNSYLKNLYNQDEDGNNSIINLTNFISESMLYMGSGESIILDDSTEDFHMLASTLSDWQEQYGSEKGFYPHDDMFASYDEKVILLSRMMENGDSLYEFIIDDYNTFFDALEHFKNYFSEVNYSSLDSAIERYISESLDAYTSELNELIQGQTPLGFSDNKTITLSKKDKVISQLNGSYFDNLEDSDVDVKRVLLVEYREPKTLQSITKNTVGALCVGNKSMRYMDRLADGTQRHFGILAQTESGLHVMYHTHYQGSDMTRAKFTNHNNAEGYSGQKQSSNPHEQILRQAESNIERLINSPRLKE